MRWSRYPKLESTNEVAGAPLNDASAKSPLHGKSFSVHRIVLKPAQGRGKIVHLGSLPQ